MANEFAFDDEQSTSGNPDATGADSAVDPNSIDGTAAEPVGERKRKRRSDAGIPRGARGSRKAAHSSLDLSAYVGIWAALHVHVATLTQTPEIALTEQEAGTFLRAVENVLKHYPVNASQKALDWGALMFVAGSIYLPRAFAIARRRKEAEKERSKEATVFPFGTAAE